MAKDKKENWQSTGGFGPPHQYCRNEEGVYAFLSIDFFTKKKSVVYVGRSMNLKQRLTHHEKYYKAIEEGIPVYTKWKHCDNSARLESSLIKKLNPLYNIHLK